jgi:hypothetical protein
MDSGAMIHISRFIKTGSGIQKWIRGIHIHRQHGDRISIILYFQNKKNRLKIKKKKNEKWK